MRLTTVILLATFLQVSASGFAQKITLSKSNADLRTILRQLRMQSGYDFIYTDVLLNKAKPVNIDVKQASLDEVLEVLFKNQPLKYSIEDHTVVIKAKEASFIEQLVARFQAIDVRGKVVGQSGSPIAGVTVRVKGAKNGTVTGADGSFQLANVDENATLVFEYLGYATREIKAAEGKDLKVVMIESATDLNEVEVSTGYTTRKIGEVTGAVQRISGDEIRRGITSADVASLLKGRTTGLYISEQGAGDPTSVSQIFVRGQSNIASVGIDQANEFVMPQFNYGPLLVLDGVIMPNQNLKDLVTPQEIAEITILKDASATAIYGSRAAGGVLVVTTIRGTAERARVNGEVKYGVNVPNQGTARWMNGPELYELQKRYFTENYKQNPGLATTYPTMQAYLDNRLPTAAEVANSYDWTKFLFKPTSTQDVNVSTSGGSDKTKYYVGAGYYKEKSTGINNDLNRKSIRINLDSRLSNRIKVNVSVNGILNDGSRDFDNNGGFQYTLIPWGNPINADGSISPSYSYKANGTVRTSENPLFSRQYNYSDLKSQLFFGSARLEYKITDWLDFSSTNSGNLNYNKNERYQDARTYGASASIFSSKGFLGTTTSNLSNYLTSNQLSLNKSFGKHALRALAAMEFGQTRVEDILVNVNQVRPGYPVISLGGQIGGRNDFSAFGIPTTKAGNVEGGKDVKAVYSTFAEAGYTYDNKYTLNASIRSDASSSFGRDNRYGTFYSAGAAWIVTKENFMQNIKWVNNLKLRASYGTSGSQIGDNFLTTTLYDPRYNYAGTQAAILSVIGNPDLKWEITKTLSGGVELGLFNRVDLTVDLYNRRSEDLLQKAIPSPLAGIPTQWRNVASVQNRGIELMLNTRNIVGKDFQWSTSFNFTHNTNKILSVANGELKQGFYDANSYFLYPGDDINSLKGVKYAGIDPQTGQPRFEKLLFDDAGNRTGVEYVNTVAEVGASNDKRQMQKIGSYQPKYFGGFINNFRYKAVSLSVMITYALNYIMNDDYAAQSQQNAGVGVTTSNQLAYRPNQVEWTTPGQTNATEPWFYYHNNTDYFGSDKYFHDGSHAALRNVRLSYDLPKELMSKLKMSNCSVYLSADNLAWIYSKNIVASNPEGPTVGSAQNFGTSTATTGIPRRYLLGLQLTF
ncbi:SusC/RagA family TonB-linked outer membrane protein [Pedobacter frigoris]|uniref:SusC/RagA family TonB-linked outer membrane protein n=1 Tax=Pedobacter frigoris TaxID=2571272 RepID=UPI00292E16C4|nr:SusC/RagA family TonB-linked outer membrane protein [Pedobacter frigoris]